MTQGVSQEGRVCCIFFLAVTATHREKEGTQGPHLPGQLKAEVLVYTCFQQAWHAVLVCLSALSSASDQSLP